LAYHFQNILPGGVLKDGLFLKIISKETNFSKGILMFWRGKSLWQANIFQYL